MSVGAGASSATVDAVLTNLSVGMRQIMTQVQNLSTWINGQGEGLAYLQSIGYSSDDAPVALSMINYLNTVAQVYFGTAEQTPAFDFNQELSQLWAGQ